MITDNYIKMCEKAKKIQKLWKLKVGDYYYEKGHHKIFNKRPYQFVAMLDKEKSYLFHKKQDDYIFYYKRFWLPTQEQLQEMLQKERDYYFSYPLAEFCGWINITGGNMFHSAEYKNQFKTVTELWLAFVMKEKWNKLWTGEDWEVKKNG